jgi:hypothetical protein
LVPEHAGIGAGAGAAAEGDASGGGVEEAGVGAAGTAVAGSAVVARVWGGVEVADDAYRGRDPPLLARVNAVMAGGSSTYMTWRTTRQTIVVGGEA